MHKFIRAAEERESITLMNEGNKLFATFHRPPGNNPVPAVLICHGFAGTKVGKHRLYVRLSEHLARQGIASLRLDFRGCGDSEGSFDETTLEDQVSDTLAGLRYLICRDGIDIERIGLLGRSMGGAVAVVAAKRFGDIKSLALWCPVYSAIPWKEQWERAMKEYAHHKNGEKPKVLFQGHVASPILFKQLFDLHVDQELLSLAHTPLLHIHSEKDEIVSIAHADEYYRCRESVLGISKFIRLKESNHEFSAPEEQQQTLEETTQWFQKTLIPQLKHTH